MLEFAFLHSQMSGPTEETYNEVFEHARKETFHFSAATVVAARVSTKTLSERLERPRDSLGANGYGLVFVIRSLPRWKARYVAWHEYRESQDRNGSGMHLSALEAEVELARRELGKRRFQDYLRWRRSVERSDFFTSGRCQRFLEQPAGDGPRNPG